MQRPRVSVVIPTLNEEANLPVVIKSLPKVDEVIVVDGGSADNTIAVAKKYGALILFDEGGKGSALVRGVKAAKGDIIITMDADCSHRGSEIGLLIEGIRGGYDACFGSRFIQGGGTGDMSLIRRVGNKIFVHAVNALWGTRYSDLCYGYRAFRKGVVEKLKLESHGFGIETEISIKAAKKRLRIIEVPSYEKARANGTGKLRTVKDGFTIFKTILKEALNHD